MTDISVNLNNQRKNIQNQTETVNSKNANFVKEHINRFDSIFKTNIENTVSSEVVANGKKPGFFSNGEPKITEYYDKDGTLLYTKSETTQPSGIKTTTYEMFADDNEKIKLSYEDSDSDGNIDYLKVTDKGGTLRFLTAIDSDDDGIYDRANLETKGIFNINLHN